MPTNSHFAPVILYSDDAKAVHDALLTSGNAELAQIIRDKAKRSRLDKIYADSVNISNDGTYDIDAEPIISQGADGAFVMVWQWVDKDEIRELIVS